MSRPRKTRVQKQSAKVVLHLTLAQKKQLDAAADRIGLPVATVARLYVMQVIEMGKAEP